jgi:hypothetical protein
MKLHEMVTSTDVGVDLIPERLYKTFKQRTDKLCDFKTDKQEKVFRSRRKKHKAKISL